jgi:predicted aspartyl protease
MRRIIRLTVELLEKRLVLSPATPPTITLDPANDEYGSQIETVTQFGDSNRVTTGILDTGASPITIAQTDQAGFATTNGALDPVPVKTPGGASGDGIGGSVTGDVSTPITVLTDGMHAATLDSNFNLTANFGPTSAKVTGIQAFIGTTGGSPDLPTISGTPIFSGAFNSSSRSKLAAKVDLINGVDVYGFGILEPDVHFVPATTKLVPGTNELQATIPLARIGASTVTAPGTDISSYYNFVANSVQLNDTVSNQVYTVPSQKFLLDTGSQLTIISTAEAGLLHINLSQPFDSIAVQGVGGSQTINGYVIDSLQVGLTGSGPLTIKNVPVFVLDAAVGIDGILGMNLWNNVDQMLINPFTPFGATSMPTLGLTWDPSYTGGSNTGGFGFKLDELLYGNRGPQSLGELLGGAAQYFRVPDHNLGSSPVSAPTTLTAGTLLDTAAVGPAAPDSSNASAPVSSLSRTENVKTHSTGFQDTVTAGPAAPVISIAFVPGKSRTHAVTTRNNSGGDGPTTGSITVAASTGSITAQAKDVVNEDAPLLADAPESGRHAEAQASDVGMDKFQATTSGTDDQDFQAPLIPGIEASSEEGVAVPSAPNASLTDAALLVVLGLFARDCWFPDFTERHFRSKIEGVRAG